MLERPGSIVFIDSLDINTARSCLLAKRVTTLACSLMLTLITAREAAGLLTLLPPCCHYLLIDRGSCSILGHFQLSSLGLRLHFTITK
ncbi:hypothetical protein XELAEV_18032346mg [Xenopus laevis]|uniref:Uncharacterized protein n=1 Tax=Xenopus laevis TaxID=8355 RepID=A0A974HGJ4_XENLA|nr:hypothetical protein XELAEV_18032346mg [Xenopus laevis]